MKECKFQKSLNIITREFKECKKVLLAIGDDTRQAIIIALLESDCNGIRVGEITKKTHLSRPAVSHHLKILKESGIINMRREGTKNYYYVDANRSEWNKLGNLLQTINEVVEKVSEKRFEEE